MLSDKEMRTHPMIYGRDVSFTVVFLPNISMRNPANRAPRGFEITPRLAGIETKQLDNKIKLTYLKIFFDIH
jgi:hypothetical protein